MIRLYIALGVLAVLGIAGAFGYRYAYQQGVEATEAKQAGAALKQTEEFQLKLAEQQQQLLATEALLSIERERVSKTKTVVRDVYRDSPEARAWGATSIPDDLRGVLDPGARHNSAVPADPGNATDSVPDESAHPRDKRRTT